MKKILIALAALAAFTSCNFVKVNGNSLSSIIGKVNIYDASDNYVTKSYEVADFEGINCSIPCELIYTAGDIRVTVDGPDNVLDSLEISTEDGILNIKQGKSHFRKVKHIDVCVSSNVLRSLDVRGAVDFKALNGIAGARNFSIGITGASDLVIRGIAADIINVRATGAADAVISGIDCKQICVVINGAGDCTLSGKAEVANLTVNGAGDLDIRGLVATEVRSQIYGAGNIAKNK